MNMKSLILLTFCCVVWYADNKNVAEGITLETLDRDLSESFGVPGSSDRSTETITTVSSTISSPTSTLSTSTSIATTTSPLTTISETSIFSTSTSIVTTTSPSTTISETSTFSTSTSVATTTSPSTTISETSTFSTSTSVATTTSPLTSTSPPTPTTPLTTTTIPTTTAVPTLRLTDDVPYLTWNPNTDGDFEVIETDEGYKLVVVIEKCNVAGAKGEHVVISTNEILSGDDTLVFTYNVKSKPTYLFNTNILYASFSGTSASVFVANFSRIGEKLTTVSTEEPTTTIILPTPRSNESYEYTNYLGGKKAAEYTGNTLQRNLKNMILGMATEYCETQNFDLTEPLNINNIIVVEIVQCPMNWPDYQTCISLTFAVPIELNEQSKSLWSGYQLTAEHLKIMWETYAEKYLIDGVIIYQPPDSTKFLKIQLIVFSAVTFIFVICLILIRQISLWLSKRMLRRRMSDTASIVSSGQRQSEISLPPHYLQETPPLFDNAYRMYNLDSISVDPSLSIPFGFSVPDFSDLAAETKDDDSGSETGPLED